MQTITATSRAHTPLSARLGDTVVSSLSSVTATVSSNPNDAVLFLGSAGKLNELDNFSLRDIEGYRAVLALGEPDVAGLLAHCDRAFHAINCKTGNPTSREIKCKITFAIFGKRGCNVRLMLSTLIILVFKITILYLSLGML